MSKSYARNIERLKANQRQVSQQEQQITSDTANIRGKEAMRNAQDWEKLTPFSDALQEWKDKDIENTTSIEKRERERATHKRTNKKQTNITKHKMNYDLMINANNSATGN